MIRMQTRTWNNLIIFVMLGMLMLFFVLNQKINTPQDIPAQLLIPHEMQLTRWQSAGIDLQRNSQGGFTETNSNQLSETAINVIRLPQQTLLQLNERYYVLLKPEGVYLIP
jgi:hypothetical protein